MQDLQRYGAWRGHVAQALERYRAWTQAAGLLDGATGQRLARALARLRDDRLTVAFVAEFSRGKSELINALFFADYGRRIVPSSPGRTTMCPTELAWDAALPPSIRLLPIETRAGRRATGDYRDDAGAWTVLPLELDAPARMTEAFRQVSLTKRVPVAEAAAYGLHDPDDPDLAAAVGADGLVEVPCWRHALINFPHPLLEQGLVIVDTPGLNAIGTEPELTLNLIPNAHAVLFVLAAETGVTKSDIEVWRTHIRTHIDTQAGAGAPASRIVVLNKIDALWDELRSPADNDAAIARQQQDVARLLGVQAAQVYPVSAQKALVGKIGGDMALFEKSRIGRLEAALFGQLVPARQDILRRQLQDELSALAASQETLLGARGRDLVEQMEELQSLRGKNQGMIAHMMRRVEMEKKEFDASLFKLQGTRAVVTTLSTELYSLIGMDVVQRQADAVRDAMQAARFSTGTRAPVRDFFAQARASLDGASAKIEEIRAMMDTMARRFSVEHGLALAAPLPLSLERYRLEIDAIETIYLKQFGTATLLMTSRATLLDRFFDTIVSRIRHAFRDANVDVEAWLQVLMSPLEARIRQHRDQLRQRQVSIQRVHDATGTLDQKIAAFDAARRDVDAARARLAELTGDVAGALRATLAGTAPEPLFETS